MNNPSNNLNHIAPMRGTISAETLLNIHNMAEKHLEHISKTRWALKLLHLTNDQTLILIPYEQHWERYWVDGEPVKNLRCAQVMMTEGQMFPCVASHGRWTCMVVTGANGMVISKGSMVRGQHYTVVNGKLSKIPTPVANYLVTFRKKAA